MFRRTLFASLLLEMLFLASCKPSPNDHVVRQQSYWKKYQTEKLEDRIFTAPPELIDYLILDAKLYDIPQTQEAVELDAKTNSDIKKALREIPDFLKKEFNKKIVGIFIVKNLGSTGFAESVFNHAKKEVAGFIVLDTKVLQRNANAWATWKERSPFKEDGPYTLNAKIEKTSSDTFSNAMQYILLHELAHIATIGENIHPSWSFDVKKNTVLNPYPFSYLSWRVSDKKYVSIFDESFPLRTKIKYYTDDSKKKFDNNLMKSIYEKVEKTSFPSLYAAKSIYEDFAESYVTYVHTVIMHKPFEITISKGNKVVKKIQLCWGQPRCAEKEKLIKKFIFDNRVIAHQGEK